MAIRNRRMRWNCAQVAGTLLWFSLSAGISSAQAALPHNIPDFTQDSSRPNVRSAQSGNWSTPATWVGGQVPTANHVVNIDPGHVVTVNDTTPVAYTVGVHGTLRFNPA